MKPSVIVWDLETVPDLGGFAAANDLVGKSDVEIREAIGDKFPKHIYHSIVCIGALIAHWEPDHWAVDAIGAPHVGERTEKELISTTLPDFSRARDSQITFSVTHGWSAFWRGRPWLAGRRIGETSSDVGSNRFGIGWVTKHGDKCARSTCRD